MRILHLSDLHLPRATGPDADGVDARAGLTRLLGDLRHLDGIDLVAVSGDVADDGSPEGYESARELVGAYAAGHGAAQVWCTGNHDERTAFAAVLGSGHLDAAGRDTAVHSVGGAERAAVSVVAGVRVVSLDSLVPGHVHGLVGERQLAWLRDVLAEPAPGGSVVVLHHPPISLDRPGQREAGLQDPEELAAVLESSDVLAVLCGHFHLQLCGRLGGVPVWVGPAAYSRIDLTAPPGVDRAVRGAAASVVDLGGHCSPLFAVLHARDPRAGEQVYLADALTGSDLMAAGDVRQEATGAAE